MKAHPIIVLNDGIYFKVRDVMVGFENSHLRYTNYEYFCLTRMVAWVNKTP